MNNDASCFSKSVHKALLCSVKKRMYKSLTTPTLSYKMAASANEKEAGRPYIYRGKQINTKRCCVTVWIGFGVKDLKMKLFFQ